MDTIYEFSVFHPCSAAAEQLPIYERLSFRDSGRYKGMSPHQAMNPDI
ncbi:MAG: hypothetical protein AB1422_05870 [bacterium]